MEDELPERVSAEAAVLSSRVHYYGRLTGSSDRLLVPPHTRPSDPPVAATASTAQARAINHRTARARQPDLVEHRALGYS